LKSEFGSPSKKGAKMPDLSLKLDFLDLDNVETKEENYFEK
jgi:hypothetical protein